MFPPRPTELLHLLLSKTIQPGDTVIDATCGNGHDTLFLFRKNQEQLRIFHFRVMEIWRRK